MVILFILVALLYSMPSYGAGRIFFDDFESYSVGTLPTTLWAQDLPNPLCTVAASAVDGVLGPYAGSRMMSCNSTSSNIGETAYVNTSDYTNELFIRVRVRLDEDNTLTNGSARKILRFFTWSDPVYRDMFESLGNYDVSTTGFSSQGAWSDVGLGGNVNITTVYDAPDDTLSPASWHTVEYYVNQSQSRFKVWQDGVLVRNTTQNGDGNGFGATKWKDFYITSNWEDSHDSTNHIYFDSFEVYSDNGSGGTGLMSDASITQGGGSVPVKLRRRNN